MILDDRHEVSTPLRLAYVSTLTLSSADKGNVRLISFIDKYGGKMDKEETSWSDDIEEWMDSIRPMEDERILREVRRNIRLWIQEWCEWRGIPENTYMSV
jgi:hypothetical protein